MLHALDARLERAKHPGPLLLAVYQENPREVREYHAISEYLEHDDGNHRDLDYTCPHLVPDEKPDVF